MLSSIASASAAVSTDKYVYNFGETVQINGDGMEAGEQVSVVVYYPNGSLAQQHEVSADTLGNFSDSFYLADGMSAGEYAVVATGQTSGNQFRTTFDPPQYNATFTSGGISPSSVDYSDIVTFSGSFTCTDQGPAANNQCNDAGNNPQSPTVTVQLKGGALADWADAASKTYSGVSGVSFTGDCPSACSTSWGGLTWQAGRLADNSVLAPGSYNVRIRVTNFGGTIVEPPNGVGAGALTITKEDTVTIYTGPSSGQKDTSVGVSATVEDEDSSKFENDSVFAGTVDWNLEDGVSTLLASTSDNTLSWNGTTKKWDASANLDLAGIGPGNYTIETVFTPSSSSPATSTYYNGSSDSDGFEVTGPTCEISRILPPVNQVSSATADGVSAWKYGAKGVVPTKFRITCDGNLVDTQAEAAALGDVKLVLKRIDDGNGGSVDETMENLVTGSANTDNLLRFDDAGDLFIYNISIKGRPVGGYLIQTSGGGDMQDEYFRIV